MKASLVNWLRLICVDISPATAVSVPGHSSSCFHAVQRCEGHHLTAYPTMLLTETNVSAMPVHPLRHRYTNPLARTGMYVISACPHLVAGLLTSSPRSTG